MMTRTLGIAACDDALLADCAKIWIAAFAPSDGTVERCLAYLRRQADVWDDTCRDLRLHLGAVEGRIVAAARSFLRVVAGPGGRFTVLALAGVACDPAEQGKGHGRAVVQAAFARLDDAVPLSLFQTGVPGFYQKLGARLVDNPFVNSGEGDRVWWNPAIMVAPGDAAWPEGEIDLLGEGW